jgi:hypothetical protein
MGCCLSQYLTPQQSCKGVEN